MIQKGSEVKFGIENRKFMLILKIQRIMTIRTRRILKF